MDTVVVSGLEQSYGPVRALRGLNLRIPPGAVGLLGPNGAGKSTLLKVLLGLLRPDAGTAEVLGIRVDQQPLEVRRRVGYMPEVDAFLPGMTGSASALFAGVMCGMPRRDAQRRAHETLYYVGLGEARYRKVDQYSTGMRQRLRLAQALIHDPALVFLDEPTNGLDPKGREEVLALIRDLVTAHGKSIVLCSHLLPDVESVCGHVVVLNQGRVALEGSVEAVRRLEQGTYRVRVSGALERFESALSAAGSESRRDGESLLVRLPPPAQPETLFRVAHDTGCVLRELSAQEQTLEGVFLRALEESA